MTNAERHEKTKAARTTTQLEAKARPAPTVQQVMAAQKPDQVIDKAGTVHKVVPTTATQLPAPALTDAERAANLKKNMAAIGARPMTFIGWEGQKNIFIVDGEELPPKGLYVCLMRRAQSGFRRFNGKGGAVDLMLRYLDEPQYSRDDLDNGYEEEDGEYGRRQRWADYILLPLIDANNGGGEMYAFETRNATSWWAAKALIGRCTEHPMFARGMSPIVRLASASTSTRSTASVASRCSRFAAGLTRTAPRQPSRASPTPTTKSRSEGAPSYSPSTGKTGISTTSARK
jgi:hypothetical protein